MTSTSDPQARRLAGRILLWQAVVTLVLAGVITLAADAAAGSGDDRHAAGEIEKGR